MIIPCFRCDKKIDKPGLISVIVKDAKGEPILDSEGEIQRVTTYNADYVIADDTKVMDDVEVIYAVDKNDKRTQADTAPLARTLPGTVRVETVMEKGQVQKTGIICPDCYLPTDTVIWGAHKET